MALVSGGVKLIVSYMDNGGDITHRTYRYVDGTTYAAAVTGLAAVLATLNALTDCVISGYSLAEDFIEDALVLPAAGIQNENQLILTVGIEGDPTESGTLTMPSPVIGAFTSPTGPGANVANVGAPVVTNFVGLFVSGGQFTFSDGELGNASDVKGKRRHTKNSNG